MLEMKVIFSLVIVLFTHCHMTFPRFSDFKQPTLMNSQFLRAKNLAAA